MILNLKIKGNNRVLDEKGRQFRYEKYDTLRDIKRLIETKYTIPCKINVTIRFYDQFDNLYVAN
jgi:hypothetical protein